MSQTLHPHQLPSFEFARNTAGELLKAVTAGEPRACERIRAYFPDKNAPLKLAQAQLVIAREHGLPSWTALREQILRPKFEAAIRLMDSGDNEALQVLLKSEPALVRMRTPHDKSRPVDYFSGAFLLHYIAGNPNRGELPGSIVESARILLEAGADSNALTTQGNNVISLVLTSRAASETGVGAALIELLRSVGAKDGAAYTEDALLGCLHNWAPETARQLGERGYPVGIRAAAGLGEIQLVKKLLQTPPRENAASRQEELNQALTYAVSYRHREIVALLLECGADIDSIPAVYPNPATALHMAPNLEMARFLVEHGANLFILDPTYGGTPADWAYHCAKPDIEEYLRECMARKSAG